MFNEDSNYEQLLRILGNSGGDVTKKYDSTFSVAYAIYLANGGEEPESYFDSLYSILAELESLGPGPGPGGNTRVFTINTDDNNTVIINNVSYTPQDGKVEVDIECGADVYWSVERTDYVTQSGSFRMGLQPETIDVVLNYQYLRFTILSDGTFMINQTRNAGAKSIKYSLDDGSTWTSVALGTSAGTPLSLNVTEGDVVLVQGDDTNRWFYNGSDPTNSNVTYYRSFQGTARYDVDGSLSALTNYQSPNGSSYAFGAMFRGANVRSARNLGLGFDEMYSGAFAAMFKYSYLEEAPVGWNITNITTNGFKQMFYACERLKDVMELPANLTVESSGMYQMYNDCIKISDASCYKFSSLAWGALTGMFWGCVSLRKAPVLDLDVDLSYYMSMFTGCKQLNYVKCNATSGTASDWLLDTQKRGVLELADSTNWTTDSYSSIPPLWEVLDHSRDTNVGYLVFNVNINNPTITVNGGVSDCIYKGTVGETVTYTIGYEGLETITGTATIENNVTCVYANLRSAGVDNDYLNIEIVTGGDLLFESSTGGSSSSSILYKLNDDDWKVLTAAPGQSVTISVEAGDMLLFDGVQYNFYNKPSGGSANSYKVGVRNSNGCTFYAYGNMDAVSLASYAYPSGGKCATFFSECTGLLSHPTKKLVLNRLHLYEAYRSLFYNCTGLTTNPVVMCGLQLGERALEWMFDGCTNLTSSPNINAIDLSSQSCYMTFYECRNLNYIKCLTPEAQYGSNTNSWTQSVAATGTFVKNSYDPEWPTGTDGIPTNWTVQTERNPYTHDVIVNFVDQYGNPITFGTADTDMYTHCEGSMRAPSGTTTNYDYVFYDNTTRKWFSNGVQFTNNSFVYHGAVVDQAIVVNMEFFTSDMSKKYVADQSVIYTGGNSIDIVVSEVTTVEGSVWIFNSAGTVEQGQQTSVGNFVYNNVGYVNARISTTSATDIQDVERGGVIAYFNVPVSALKYNGVLTFTTYDGATYELSCTMNNDTYWTGDLTPVSSGGNSGGGSTDPDLPPTGED